MLRQVVATPSTPVEPLVNPPSAQDPAARAPGWAEVLFSFRGRIARKQFLIGLIFVMAVALAFLGAITLTVNEINKKLQGVTPINALTNIYPENWYFTK